jgi:hypothetical protein
MNKVKLSGKPNEPTLDQSIWRARGRKIWTFLCPFCGAPRRIPFRPQPGGWRQIGQVILTAWVMTGLTWPWLGWKGIVSVIPLWTAFEIFYRWRARGVLSCSLCGFDPYLFMIDEEWARREMETHWRQKFAEKGIPFPEKPPGPGVTPPGNASSGAGQKPPSPVPPPSFL